MLLDCCHAGGVGEAEAGLSLVKAPLPPEALALLAEGRGRVLIASSRGEELSFAGRPYSAFTLALIEALCGQGVARPGCARVRVADLALHHASGGSWPHPPASAPILRFEHADNFAVAYYAGGVATPKGLPFAAQPEIEPEPGTWQAMGGVTVHGDQIASQGPVTTRGSTLQARAAASPSPATAMW